MIVSKAVSVASLKVVVTGRTLEAEERTITITLPT